MLLVTQYQADHVSSHGIGLQSINLQVILYTHTHISVTRRGMYSNPTFRTFNVKGMHIEGTDNAHAVNVNEMRYNPLQLLLCGVKSPTHFGLLLFLATYLASECNYT